MRPRHGASKQTINKQVRKVSMSNVNVVRGAWDPSGAAKTVPSVIVGIKNSLEVAYVADRDSRDEDGDFTN